jgi:hypothetical protein
VLQHNVALLKYYTGQHFLQCRPAGTCIFMPLDGITALVITYSLLIVDIIEDLGPFNRAHSAVFLVKVPYILCNYLSLMMVINASTHEIFIEKQYQPFVQIQNGRHCCLHLQMSSHWL